MGRLGNGHHFREKERKRQLHMGKQFFYQNIHFLIQVQKTYLKSVAGALKYFIVFIERKPSTLFMKTNIFQDVGIDIIFQECNSFLSCFIQQDRHKTIFDSVIARGDIYLNFCKMMIFKNMKPGSNEMYMLEKFGMLPSVI